MILGCDLSHWNANVNMAKVAKAGVKFMIAKCSDANMTTGVEYFDDKFLQNIINAKREGILTGAYHFFQPKFSASSQARAYFNQCSKVKPDLPPVIDLETSGGQSNAVVKANVLAFAQKTKELWGEYPIIYSRDGLIKQFGLMDYIKDPNLYWKAMYSNKPTGYPSKFWQFSEKFRIPGIACNLDGDYYLGTIEELTASAGTPSPIEPEPSLIGKTGKVVCGVLNIRSGPGIEYRVVGHLHIKASVTVLDVQNERWLQIGDGFVARISEQGTLVQF